MAIRTMSLVWDHSTLGGTELLLLLAIADFADETGRAWPSVATLAKKIRMSERNARYLLKKIAATGELVVEHGKGPRGCNLFRVQTLQGANLAGLQPVATVGGNGWPRGAAIAFAPEPSVNHQGTVNSSAKNTEQAKNGEPLGFSECWDTYPRREGGNSRPDALKAYKGRLKTGVPPEDLLAAVKRYAVFIRAKGQEGTAYVKQASTFFGTGEHWKEPWAVAGVVETVTDWTRDPKFAGCAA